jgi:hypothetical protein
MTGNSERLFCHPRGIFELRIQQRDPDLLCQVLLASGSSFVMLSSDCRDVENRKLALNFVDIADEITNGLTRFIKQRRREEARLEFVEMHDELLRRGYNVLSGRVATAIHNQPRFDVGGMTREWTDRVDSTAIVITDAGISEAVMLMPCGHVAPDDKGVIEPTRELGWGE